MTWQQYNRRGLMVGGVAAGASLLLGRQILSAQRAFDLSGKLNVLGPAGTLYAPSLAAKNSILISIDLRSGITRQTDIPITEGHSAIGLGDGRILCISHHADATVVVDPLHQVIKKLRSAPGYVFGGHAIVRPGDQDVFVLPQRHSFPQSAADTGLFDVYDIATLEKVDQKESGGLHPHELCAIPGTDELCVTHYGDIHSQRRPLRHNTIEAKLTIYDAKSLRVKRHYPVPEFQAMLTHMRVAADQNAYCVMTQFVVLDQDLESVEQKLSKAREEVDRFVGRRTQFRIPHHSISDGTLALPLPLLRIDTQTGRTELILTNDQSHLRSQSVALNRYSGIAVATYFHSNTLVLHKAGTAASIIRGEELGLTEMRGVSEIPETPYVAVSSSYKGIAIVDLRSRSVVTRFPTKHYEAPHIDFASA